MTTELTEVKREQLDTWLKSNGFTSFSVFLRSHLLPMNPSLAFTDKALRANIIAEIKNVCAELNGLVESINRDQRPDCQVLGQLHPPKGTTFTHKSAPPEMTSVP